MLIKIVWYRYTIGEPIAPYEAARKWLADGASVNMLAMNSVSFRKLLDCNTNTNTNNYINVRSKADK